MVVFEFCIVKVVGCGVGMNHIVFVACESMEENCLPAICNPLDSCHGSGTIG